MSALHGPGMPEGLGFFMDSLFRWYLFLDGAPGLEALTATGDRMDDLHLRDAAFQAPGLLATKNMLQGLALTSHLDTPFFRWCLGPPASRERLWARPLSRFPLWGRHYRIRWNLDPAGLSSPGAAGLRASARKSAADLIVSLRLFGRSAWAGSPSYRLFFLLSRILSLRLYLAGGLPCDPQDIDALRACLE